MTTQSNPSRLFVSLGLVVALATGVLSCASPANAQASLVVLHSFTGGGIDGAEPRAGLIQGPDGTLYGTTSLYVGTAGTVFQIASDGSSYAVLHDFTADPADGLDLWAGLIQGPDGTLYGMTVHGGSANQGTIFKLAADGSGFSVLHSFTGGETDGAFPQAGLIQGSDGTLYGTTAQGGTANQGTIFKLAADGSGFTVLYSFTGGAGGSGGAFLIQAPDGTLYGTSGGGTAGWGMVFQIAADGSGFTVLHSFSLGTDGVGPAYLIQALDGTLYGTSRGGGSGNGGTIFRMACDGSGYTILHYFTGYPDGAIPYAGLIQGPDGTLYGTTYYGGTSNLGTVFQMAPDGSGFTVLYSFTGTDGTHPGGGLIQGPDGTLYGTTYYGGTSDIGVVFQLTLSPSAPTSSRAGRR